MSAAYNKLIKERNLIEQELISTHLKANEVCFECEEIQDKVKELKKQLKEYDKKISKESRPIKSAS